MSHMVDVVFLLWILTLPQRRCFPCSLSGGSVFSLCSALYLRIGRSFFLMLTSQTFFPIPTWSGLCTCSWTRSLLSSPCWNQLETLCHLSGIALQSFSFRSWASVIQTTTPFGILKGFWYPSTSMILPGFQFLRLPPVVLPSPFTSHSFHSMPCH